MKTYGNVGTGHAYSSTTRPDLPRLAGPVVHRPWCVDCKRKHDASDLDNNGRCQRCARAAVVEAAAAERRAREDAERRALPTPPPSPAPAPSRTRTAPRRPRRVPGSQAAPAVPVVVRRTVDHSARIGRLEERRARLRMQLADVDRELDALRGEHGTEKVLERRRSDNRRNGPERLALPVEEIAEAYQAGATLAELAERYGCSGPTIGRALDDVGVARRRQRVDYSDAELLDQVRHLYVEEQLTQADVAERLGVTLKIVQTAMTRGEIPARESASERSRQGIGHPIKIEPERHQEIVDRYRAGESAPAIARDFDVSASAIYHVLERNGITERHGNRSTPGVDRHGNRSTPGVDRHGNRSTPGVDGAAGLKHAIAAVGVDVRTIKEWALTRGLLHPPLKRGLPPTHIVEAYAQEHTT